MKLRPLSDLHMEGYKYFYEWAGEDVLLLVGDIHTRNRLHLLLEQIPQYVKVVFAPGNHEYYNNEFHTANEYFDNLAKEYNNFYFLNNTNIVIDGVNFFGGAMYTDLELNGMQDLWFVKQDVQQKINDFGFTMIGERDWNTQDHIDQHAIFVRELKHWLDMTEGMKRIVLSHFIPTPKHIHPRFLKSALNPYFTSDMEKYMGWEGLWIHGHGHDSFDTMIGDTRVISNPRGYADENKYGFNDKLIIEI